MSRMRCISRTALVLGISATALTTRADDVPSWFVPADKCMSRPCMCDDMPMLEAYIQNQKDAQDAWKTVSSDIGQPGGPTSGPAAIKLFQSRFPGDPRIGDHFKMCSSYDPAKNKLSKVAGVSPLGTASLDPCFCEAFCQDIIDATVEHEKTHVPTIIMGVLANGDMLIGCSLGIGPSRLCGALEPTIIANSELISHKAGIDVLEAAAARIPTESSVQCTWEPLPPWQPPPQMAAIPSPPGFMARLQLILTRIVCGAVPTDSLSGTAPALRGGAPFALLDAHRR